MDNRGTHVTADVYLPSYPGDTAAMEACETAIKASNMTVISCAFKRFDPHGVTAVWILSESHFTLHTYPEHRYVSVDCYTCGAEGNPKAAIEKLLSLLGADGSATIRAYVRGERPAISDEKRLTTAFDVAL